MVFPWHPVQGANCEPMRINYKSLIYLFFYLIDRAYCQGFAFAHELHWLTAIVA